VTFRLSTIHKRAVNPSANRTAVRSSERSVYATERCRWPLIIASALCSLCETLIDTSNRGADEQRRHGLKSWETGSCNFPTAKL